MMCTVAVGRHRTEMLLNHEKSRTFSEEVIAKVNLKDQGEVSKTKKLGHEKGYSTEERTWTNPRSKTYS